MTDLSSQEIAAYFGSRVPAVKQVDRKEWRGQCPVHSGKDPNFAVNPITGFSFCHSQCGKGWDLFGLEMELSGCNFPKAKKNVYRIIGRPEPRDDEWNFEAVYDYTDEKGGLLYQVIRKFGKEFTQRRPDSKGGWIWGLGDIRRVPFRLHKIAAADVVYVAEGEKDVLTMERLGVVATCNNGGAGNFPRSIAEHFTLKNVGIIPDEDDKGREHALKVAEMLSPVAASVKIIELPGMREKGDVTDFINSGGTLKIIEECYRRAQEWTPEWTFSRHVPDENDKYIRTIGEVIRESGGTEKFWRVVDFEGLPTPFDNLTECLNGGLRNGEVYVIGADQGAGKTSLALQFITKPILQKNGVLLFSMEMGKRDVIQRLIAMEAHVDLQEFRKLQKYAPQSARYREMELSLYQQTNLLGDCPLLVSGKTGVTPEYLKSEAKRMNKRIPIRLIVVDHLQLMGADTKTRGDYERFTAVSRACKEVAMELGVPLILVSQTSRSHSADKRTELEVHDLRGSGAIEEDAAGVFLLYPDAKDKQRAIIDCTFSKGPVKSWLKIGKNRFGEQGKYICLNHFKGVTKFCLLAAETQSSGEDI